MRRYVKAKRVAVAGVRHNCHEHHGFQAEPQATADPARCASEPRPYLRSSALTNTCEALAMYLPGTCAGRSSAARTDRHYSAGKTKAVMLGGLAHSAQRSSIKKQAAQHDRAARQRHATASWCLAIAVRRIGH